MQNTKKVALTRLAIWCNVNSGTGITLQRRDLQLLSMDFVVRLAQSFLDGSQCTGQMSVLFSHGSHLPLVFLTDGMLYRRPRLGLRQIDIQNFVSQFGLR